MVERMQTLFSTSELMIFMMVLVLVTFLPIVLCMFRRRESVRTVTLILFIIYIFGNLSFTILNRETLSTSVLATPGNDFRTAFSLDYGIGQTVRLLLAGEFQQAISSIHIDSADMAAEIVLNILLYLPMGYLLPFVFKSLRGHIVLITMIGFLCSLATELAQYYLQIGICQLDDLVLNTLGTLIGAMIGSLLAWMFRTK